MKNVFIKKFTIDKNHLAADEKTVLPKLEEAAQLIAGIYSQQVNDKYPGANFYPHDATKEEIEKAAKDDPQILGPYTIVERREGKLISIPYHIKYKKQLEPVARLLLDAAALSKSSVFAKRLELQSKALLDGSYEESDIYWLSMKPFVIDFVIGPIERYDDRLFFRKCAYQAWIGLLDKENTDETEVFKDVVIAARKKVFIGAEKVDFLDRIKIRTDQTVIYTGLIAKFMFGAVNLPNDVSLMEKYGTSITISLPALKEKFNNQYYPIFESLFEKSFKKSYTREELLKGAIRNSYLHELSHPMLRFRNAEERLGELFPIYDEISAYVLGVKNAGILLLKDFISQKEVETILIMFICRAFATWMELKHNPARMSYVQGYAIILNHLLVNGAIQERGGICWTNFPKLYITMSELVALLERILESGSQLSANEFIKNYGSLAAFNRLGGRIEGVKI